MVLIAQELFNDQSDPDNAMQPATIEAMAATHPSIYDPGGVVGVDRLKVAQLPATIYVDAKGVMRGRTQGPVTYDDLADVAARIRAAR